MHYKIATCNDIDAVLELHYRYQVDFIDEADKKDGFVTTPFSSEQLSALIEQEQGLFIAEDNGKIVAYVMAASWQFWSAWPMFAFMIEGLTHLEYKGKRLHVNNSYQYGPICIDKSVRGSGVLEGIFEFALAQMAPRYEILVTFINKINPRSYEAHTRKLGLDVIDEFEYNNNHYYELAYETNKAYLEATEIINFDHPLVAAKAKELAQGCADEIAIAHRCFEFVRDSILHTGDAGQGITTCNASEVLEQGSGWCYAKSHLLAALLRGNGIPAALCYQRLSCGEYKEGIFCLHGLNAVYLKPFGWYRIDARGNKTGVNAQFDPPHEKLAFELGEGEYDLAHRYVRALESVIQALKTRKNYDEMIGHFPDQV